MAANAALEAIARADHRKTDGDHLPISPRAAKRCRDGVDVGRQTRRDLWVGPRTAGPFRPLDAETLSTALAGATVPIGRTAAWARRLS